MNAAEAFWTAAALAGTATAILLARRAALHASVAYWAAAAALLGGVGGAILLGFYDYGLPGGLFNPLAEGKSFLGGLFGGAVCALVYLRSRRVSVPVYGDVLVTALALGYAIGRVGCFFNGCDFGVVSGLPWAVRYPPGTEAYEAHLARGWITPDQPLSLAVHPVQLYSAACGLVIFCILVFSNSRWPGACICQFAVLYGTYRFCMEFVRGDFRPLVAGLSLPQVFSIVLIVGGLGFAFWKARRKNSPESNDRVATLRQARASS